MKCLLSAGEPVSLQGIGFDHTGLIFAPLKVYSAFYLPFLQNLFFITIYVVIMQSVYVDSLVKGQKYNHYNNKKHQYINICYI